MREIHQASGRFSCVLPLVFVKYSNQTKILCSDTVHEVSDTYTTCMTGTQYSFTRHFIGANVKIQLEFGRLLVRSERICS